LAAAALLLLAGCGAPPEHSAAKTRSCLQDAGLRISAPKGDFVATTATEGSFRAYIGRNFVTLSFGADDAEAKSTVDGYVRFHGNGFGLGNLLFTDRNVVMLWKQEPSDAQATKVVNCLK
jgi:hypothetical protein